MVKLRSLKPHTYEGRTVEAGEEYEVGDQYAATLISLGRAARIDEESGTASTETKAMTGKTGEYQTRDLKADASKTATGATGGTASTAPAPSTAQPAAAPTPAASTTKKS